MMEKKNKTYICLGCEEEFKDIKKLVKHQSDNIYEFNYEFKKERYYCKICNNSFSSYEKFIRHWEYSFDHDDAAYYKIVHTIKDKRKSQAWVVRPVHKMLVARHIKEDSDKKALKWDKDVTGLLGSSLMFAFKYNDFNVIEIVGPSGHGKSTLGLYLAAWMQNIGLKTYNRLPSIFISFSEDETQAYMRHAKQGDIIIQDESPNLVGAGKNWFRDNLQNLMDTMRAANIHFIFISPRADAIGNLNQQVILEAYARNFEIRENRFAMYDRQRAALGWVQLPILDDDDPLMVTYLKKKMDNIASLKGEGGSRSGGGSLKDKSMRDIDKLFDFITTSELYANEHIVNMPAVEITGIAEELLTGTSGYIRSIVRVTKRKLNDYVTTGMSERVLKDTIIDKRKGNRHYFINTENIEVFEILKDIYNTDVSTLYYNDKDLPIYYENDIIIYDEEKDSYIKNPDCDFSIYKNTSNQDAKIAIGRAFFALYILGSQSGDAAAEYLNETLGLTYNRENYLNVYQKAYRESIILATAAEIAVKDWFYPNAEHVAGQSQPDLLHKDYIVEVKIRSMTDKRNINEIIFTEGGSYLYDYIERGYPIKAVRVFWGKKGVKSVCYVEFYDITYESLLDEEKE